MIQAVLVIVKGELIEMKTILHWPLSILFGLVLFAGSVFAQSGTTSEPTKSVAASADQQSLGTVAGDEFEPTRLLAVVGDEPIFVGDMLFEVNQLIARFMPNAPANVVKRERKGLIEKLLPKFIEQKLLLIDVKNGLPEQANFDDILKSSSSEFDDQALEKMMESAGVDSPVQFDAHLRAQGSSLRKLRESWTVNQIVRYFLSQKIKTDSEVSHRELLEYYREHASEYAFKAEAKWEQVMVRHDRYSSQSEAMSKIVELGNKIVYGASLDGVAKKESHGFNAAEGGQHDWTTQGSLVSKELDKAIFSLPLGQLSDIIKTDLGFHIIRVVNRKDAGKIEFREAQIEIKKKLESERRLAAYDDHLENLKKSIPVEIIGRTNAAVIDRSASKSNQQIR